MNFKLLVAGLAAGVLVVSSAIAANQGGESKPPASGAGCKPRIAVVLKGTLAGKPANAVTVDVKSGNRWARAYVGKQWQIAVGPGTKIRRQGQKTLGALVVGDRVHVQARVCKADLADNKTPALNASKVVAHPANAAKDKDEKDKDEKDKDD